MKITHPSVELLHKEAIRRIGTGPSGLDPAEAVASFEARAVLWRKKVDDVAAAYGLEPAVVMAAAHMLLYPPESGGQNVRELAGWVHGDLVYEFAVAQAQNPGAPP